MLVLQSELCDGEVNEAVRIGRHAVPLGEYIERGHGVAEPGHEVFP